MRYVTLSEEELDRLILRIIERSRQSGRVDDLKQTLTWREVKAKPADNSKSKE